MTATELGRGALQQHVVLKKSTQDAYKKWNQQDRAWVDMRLHESHDEGGFGIANNTITQTRGRVHNERQVRCLPGHLCLPSSTGLEQHSPRRRLVQAAALLQMQAQTRSLSPQAPKTTATANSSFRSSTASTRHSSGVGFPPRRLPALRTSPLGPGPFSRNAVSPSSSPRNGPSTRPSASAPRARVLRSSASSTCLRSTRPRSRNPLSAWK